MAYPRLYDADVITPSGNGYGFLSDCLECKISETLNGEYKLDMSYPLGGIHSEEIKEGRLIYAKRDNGDNEQLFRIAEIDIDYITRSMNIYAPHISRDLSNYPAPLFYRVTEPNTIYDATYLWSIFYYVTPEPFITRLNEWGAFIDVDIPFTFYNSGEYEHTTTAAGTVRDTGGESIFSSLERAAELYNKELGVPLEFEFDNRSVKFWEHRGGQSNVTVRYAKNLTSIQSKQTTTELPTACIPYWEYKNANEETCIGSGRSIVAGSFYDADDPQLNKIAIVDFTSEMSGYEGPDAFDWNNAQTRLTEAATAWNNQNALTIAEQLGVTIDFNYLDLANAAQYWQGPTPEQNTADIGDYIQVIYPDAGLNTNLEIVSVVYDSLKERYETVTAGQLRKTLSQTIEQIARS